VLYINFARTPQKLYNLIAFMQCFYINLEQVFMVWKGSIWVGFKKKKDPNGSRKKLYFGSFLYDAVSMLRKYWKVFKTLFRLFLKYQHVFLLSCLFLVIYWEFQRGRLEKSLGDLKWFMHRFLYRFGSASSVSLIYFCLLLVSSKVQKFANW